MSFSFCGLGNKELIREVGSSAESEGRNNVAFLSHFISGQLHQCLELLLKTNRVPEAAFFARYVWSPPFVNYNAPSTVKK